MKTTQCFKQIAVASFTAVALLAFTSSARAAVLIDFSTGSAGVGGLLTISGGDASGSNIPVNQLLVFGAPSNNGVFDTSGTAAGSTAASLSFDTATGLISIIGGVPLLGIPDNTVLLSGTITSFTIIANTASGGQIALGGIDVKSSLLLAALGLSTDTAFELFASSIGFNPSLTGSPYTVTSTDIQNVSVVPEPGSMVLLGTGLLGLAGAARRRFKKPAARA